MGLLLSVALILRRRRVCIEAASAFEAFCIADRNVRASRTSHAQQINGADANENTARRLTSSCLAFATHVCVCVCHRSANVAPSAARPANWVLRHTCSGAHKTAASDHNTCATPLHPEVAAPPPSRSIRLTQMKILNFDWVPAAWRLQHTCVCVRTAQTWRSKLQN